MTPALKPPTTAFAAGAAAAGLTLPMFEPALWGFCGALIYGGFELAARLWGDAGAPAVNARKLALARFFVGLVLGAASAQQFSLPLVQLFARLGMAVERGAVCLGLGLFSLYLYPIVQSALGRRMRREIEGER